MSQDLIKNIIELVNNSIKNLQNTEEDLDDYFVEMLSDMFIGNDFKDALDKVIKNDSKDALDKVIKNDSKTEEDEESSSDDEYYWQWNCCDEMHDMDKRCYSCSRWHCKCDSDSYKVIHKSSKCKRCGMDAPDNN
jgi:hypothetical protein